MVEDKTGFEWLQWRRDSQRSGRCSLPGRIHKPGIIASADAGVMEDFIALSRKSPDSELLLTDDIRPVDESALRRELSLDRYIDLDGDGVWVKVDEDHRTRYGHFTQDKAWERLYFESAFDKGMVGDDTRGWLERRVNGAWERVYETPHDTHYWRVSPVLSDTNGDGEDEIVITAHYRIMAFDKASGRKLKELKYHNYRNYGDLHAYDFKGDGVESYVQITYFPAHYELIHNTRDGFEVAWFEDVQNGDITDNYHGLLSPLNPIEDVDGDGKAEIVISRYNQHNDLCWHTLVIEPLSGNVKADIPNFVVKDIFALPDGAAGLFGARSTGYFIPTRGHGEIYRLEGGAARSVWYDAAYAFADCKTYCYDNLKRCSYPGWQFAPIVRDERSVALLGKTEDSDVFAWAGWDGSALRIEAKICLPPFTVYGYDREHGRVIVKTRRSDKVFKARADALAARLLGSRPFFGVVDIPAAALDEDGKIALFLPDQAGSLIKLSYEGQGLIQTKLTDGHGMAGARGVAVGRAGASRFIACAAPNNAGELLVKAVSTGGDILWTHTVRGVHHKQQREETGITETGSGMTDFGGMFGLMTAPLLESGHDDVLVSYLMGNQHSARTIALRGDTGELIWEREKLASVWGEARGFGGTPFAGYPKKDGTEDIVVESPDLFCMVDGQTGDFEVYHRTQNYTFYQYDAKNDLLTNGPVLHGYPVVLKSAPPQSKFDLDEWVVLWGGCSFVTALWGRYRESGGFVWSTPFFHSIRWQPVQGVGRLTGDGKLKIVGYEHRHDAIMCRDLDSGVLEGSWGLPDALPPASRARGYYVTCDINGDGRDECMVYHGDNISCLGFDGEEPVVRWTVGLPAYCSRPILTDINNDGYTEIVLPCADGRIYVIGDVQ